MKDKIQSAIDHAIEREQEDIVSDFAAEGVSKEICWDDSWNLAKTFVFEKGFEALNFDYDICDCEDESEMKKGEKIFNKILS